MNRKSTEKMELVETQNLALSIARLHDSAPYDQYRWRRALYHALCMNCSGNREIRKKIREALDLP